MLTNRSHLCIASAVVLSASLLASGCSEDVSGVRDVGGVEPVDVGPAPSPDAAESMDVAGPVDDAGVVDEDTGVGGMDAIVAAMDATPPDAGRGDGGVPSIQFPGRLENWCSGQPENFSFFVTSMNALWALANTPIDDLSGGLGGDFQGLAGADAVCQHIAIATGNGHRTWRAFLSATDDGQGNPVHAINRIGAGPWHDANGRLVATGISGLLQGNRPDGDPRTIDDLPDECGVPLSALGDSHDIVTASNTRGELNNTNPESTCFDWTSSDGTVGVRIVNGRSRGMIQGGHSFPRASGGGPGGNRGQHWLSDHSFRGCGKGANLIQNGPGTEDCIGCSGGYGALYCFAAQ